MSGQIFPIVVWIDINEAKPAHHIGRPENWLAEVAVARLLRCVAGAGLRVSEDRGKYGLHVATDIVAVVDEDRRYPRNIGGAGITFHQVLDQLLADKRGQVGMLEHVAQS